MRSLRSANRYGAVGDLCGLLNTRVGWVRNMDLNLDGHVVLVTGGSDGLGAALAGELVTAGARVAICARDVVRLERTAGRLRAMGGDVLGIAADVTCPEDVENFIQAAVARWGRLDALVNNAGVSSAGPFLEITDDEWNADLQLKLFAAARAARAALPHLRASGGGSITNVLNIGAKAPTSRSLPTSVSRAAGMAMTKALSKEFGPDGVRVNAVLIGFVESPQWERLATARDMTVEDLYREVAQRVPLGRVGRAQEFADLVCFMVSPRCSYLSGVAVNLDGGLSPVV